jgi:hypothetical protein
LELFGLIVCTKTATTQQKCMTDTNNDGNGWYQLECFGFGLYSFSLKTASSPAAQVVVVPMVVFLLLLCRRRH